MTSVPSGITKFEVWFSECSSGIETTHLSFPQMTFEFSELREKSQNSMVARDIPRYSPKINFYWFVFIHRGEWQLIFTQR